MHLCNKMLFCAKLVSIDIISDLTELMTTGQPCPVSWEETE